MVSEPPVIYIVDDDASVRDALSALVVSAGYDAVPCESAEDFPGVYDPERTGCLLLDIRMPDINGLDFQESLVAQNIKIPIIIISGHGNVRNAVRAMQAGAVDFIEKPFRRKVLLDRVRKGITLDARRKAKKAEHTEFEQRLNSLTERERETLDILIKGYTAKEAALVLGISHRTVEAHRNKILVKLQTDSMVELAREITAYRERAENR